MNPQSNKERSFEDFLIVLDEIKALRIEMKDELIRINESINTKIASILFHQTELFKEANEQNMRTKEIEHHMKLELAKVDLRLKMLEQFKYLLLLAVFVGCVMGSSLASYFPSIVKALI